jgi:hypothetical protein
VSARAAGARAACTQDHHPHTRSVCVPHLEQVVAACVGREQAAGRVSKGAGVPDHAQGHVYSLFWIHAASRGRV